jgi:uncharacterized repeat protein (TIGR03943 family)
MLLPLEHDTPGSSPSKRGLASVLNGLTLVGIGIVLLDFFFTGRVDQYLHPQFRPFTLVAGIIFCAIGLVYAAAKPTARCCVDGECVHENATNPLRSVIAVLVLFVPLVAGVALSKDSYDQQGVLNRGFVQDITKLPVRASTAGIGAQASQPIPAEALGADKGAAVSGPLPQDSPPGPANNDSANPAVPNSGEGSEQYLPKAPDGNVSLEVTDLLYAEQEESLRKIVGGKTIEVIGQYLPGPDTKQFKLVRMFIVCCAADARPVALPVEATGQISASEMGWIRVTGKAAFTQSGDRTHVLMKADKVESVDPPAEAMLY